MSTLKRFFYQKIFRRFFPRALCPVPTARLQALLDALEKDNHPHIGANVLCHVLAYLTSSGEWKRSKYGSSVPAEDDTLAWSRIHRAAERSRGHL